MYKCIFQYRNFHLTAEVQTPNPDQLSQLMRQTNNSYEYNSISGFYATIQNSYATINFQLGLKRVLSFWASFITSQHINNFQYNSFARNDLRSNPDGTGLVKLKEVFFTRDAIRFPQEYIMTTVKHAVVLGQGFPMAQGQTTSFAHGFSLERQGTR